MEGKQISTIQEEIMKNPLLQEHLSFVEETLTIDLPDETFFSKYKPDERWFILNGHTVHGIDHVTRVLVLSELLGRLAHSRGVEFDKEAVRWAASTHDARRIEEGYDTGHGERSADWFLESFPAIEGLDREKAAYIIRWHVPHDEHAPEMTQELSFFKDADGLDRVRIGALNPDYLRSDEARKMTEIAQYLCSISSELQAGHNIGGYESVIKAGRMLGIISRSPGLREE